MVTLHERWVTIFRWKNQVFEVNMLLTFILSVEWERLEKELKEGSTAWVTAIKQSDMATGVTRTGKFLFSFGYFCILFIYFFYMPTSPSANRKSDSSSPGLSSQLQSTQCKQATESCLLFIIACLLSLPPLSCLSLSAASLTSNLSFSCRFRPLGGGAYV